MKPFTMLAFATTCALAVGIRAGATTNVSAADRAFVAMVSQGGAFEVQAGTVGASQGTTQDVRDQGNTEVHDHTLVGAKLKNVAAAAGLSFPDALNASFRQELDSLRAAPPARFDALYLQDMLDIHAKDGAAFAKEAASGTNSGLRAFAAETYRIVQRHIGELRAEGPATP